MINSKGENIYTNAEIAYELGISPGTVNAVAKRIFGGCRIPHWTLKEAELIVKAIKSLSIQEESARLEALHDVVIRVIGEKPIDCDEKKVRNGVV